MYGVHVRARPGGFGALRTRLFVPQVQPPDAAVSNMSHGGAKKAEVVHRHVEIEPGC